MITVKDTITVLERLGLSPVDFALATYLADSYPKALLKEYILNNQQRRSVA